jgi:hypothetical protein
MGHHVVVTCSHFLPKVVIWQSDLKFSHYNICSSLSYFGVLVWLRGMKSSHKSGIGDGILRAIVAHYFCYIKSLFQLSIQLGHHHLIFVDVLKKPPDLSPKTEYGSTASTVTLITTTVNNRCGNMVRRHELMIFYVDPIIWLFHLTWLCHCWYLSPQNESSPAATSTLYDHKIEHGAWAQGEKKLTSIFYLDIIISFVQVNIYALITSCSISQPPD